MAAPRVVDTSAWIEWLTASALGQKLGKQFPDKAQCIVPTIVQLELSKWLVREVDEEAADQVIAFTQKCVVVPLDTPIALLAADLHRQHKLATADAIDDWDFALQLNRFNEAVAAVREAGLETGLVHCDNTPGTVLHPECHYDMCRVGIGLYGLQPAETTPRGRWYLKERPIR